MIILTDLNTSTLQCQKIPLNKLKKISHKINLIDFNKKTSLENVKIYWGNRLTETLYKKLKNLKWIHYGSSGFNETIVLDALKKKIIVTHSPEIYVKPVISTVIGYIFSVFRGLHKVQNLKKGKYIGRKYFNKNSNIIKDVYGSNILIVGYGRIAKKLEQVLKIFDINLTIIAKSNIKNLKIHKIDQLKKKVRNQNCIINLLPNKQKYTNLFNKKIFKNFDKDTLFINVGRGETINEKDLIYFIKNKKIYFACLDVILDEPIHSNHPLTKVENIVVSPHIAGFTNNFHIEQLSLFKKNLTLFLNNKISKMKFRINNKRLGEK